MHQMAGTTFGIGTPFTGNPSTVWGLSPQTSQAFGFQPFSPQPFQQGLSNLPFGSGGQSYGAYGMGMAQPLQQLQQLLQIVPQQLQYIQQLQQQQLVYLQQLIQYVPAQLQQLQQLVHTIPQQLQQHQWQPFGQGTQQSGLGFGVAPQAFGGQVGSHVM